MKNKMLFKILPFLIILASCDTGVSSTTEDDSSSPDTIIPDDYVQPSSGFSLIEGPDNFTISDIIAFIPTMDNTWCVIEQGTISDIPGVRHIQGVKNISEDTTTEDNYCAEGQFWTVGSSEVSETPTSNVFMTSDGNFNIKYFGPLYYNRQFTGVGNMTYGIHSTRWNDYDYSVDKGIVTINYYSPDDPYNPYYVYQVAIDENGDGYCADISTTTPFYYIFNNFRLVAKVGDGSTGVNVAMYSNNGTKLYNTALVRDGSTFSEVQGEIAFQQVPPSFFDETAMTVTNGNSINIFDIYNSKEVIEYNYYFTGKMAGDLCAYISYDFQIDGQWGEGLNAPYFNVFLDYDGTGYNIDNCKPEYDGSVGLINAVTGREWNYSYDPVSDTTTYYDNIMIISKAHIPDLTNIDPVTDNQIPQSQLDMFLLNSGIAITPAFSSNGLESSEVRFVGTNLQLQ